MSRPIFGLVIFILQSQATAQSIATSYLHLSNGVRLTIHILICCIAVAALKGEKMITWHNLIGFTLHDQNFPMSENSGCVQFRNTKNNYTTVLVLVLYTAIRGQDIYLYFWHQPVSSTQISCRAMFLNNWLWIQMFDFLDVSAEHSRWLDGWWCIWFDYYQQMPRCCNYTE